MPWSTDTEPSWRCPAAPPARPGGRNPAAEPVGDLSGPGPARPGHRRAPPAPAGRLQRWERSRSMELWQMGVMGGVHLADGTELKVGHRDRRPLPLRRLRRAGAPGRRRSGLRGTAPGAASARCAGPAPDRQRKGVHRPLRPGSGPGGLRPDLHRERDPAPAHRAVLPDHHRQGAAAAHDDAPGVLRRRRQDLGHGRRRAGGPGRLGGPRQHRAAAPGRRHVPAGRAVPAGYLRPGAADRVARTCGSDPSRADPAGGGHPLGRPARVDLAERLHLPGRGDLRRRAGRGGRHRRSGVGAAPAGAGGHPRRALPTCHAAGQARTGQGGAGPGPAPGPGGHPRPDRGAHHRRQRVGQLRRGDVPGWARVGPAQRRGLRRGRFGAAGRRRPRHPGAPDPARPG